MPDVNTCQKILNGVSIYNLGVCVLIIILALGSKYTKCTVVHDSVHTNTIAHTYCQCTITFH